MTQLLARFEPGYLVLTHRNTQMWSVSTLLKALSNGEWIISNFKSWDGKLTSVLSLENLGQKGGGRTLPSRWILKIQGNECQKAGNNEP